MRSASARTLPVGLAVALALHVLGLATVALMQQHLVRSPPLAAAAPEPADPLIWFEREEAPVVLPEPAVGQALSSPLDPAEQRVALAVTPRRALPPEALPPEALPPEALPPEEAADDGVPGSDPASQKSVAENADSPAAPSGGKRLSLAQIGVGHGSNPFLAPSASGGPASEGAPSDRGSSHQPSSRRPWSRQLAAETSSGGSVSGEQLGQRIDHVLRSALAEHDRELGLGPEGPAVAAVLDLVMQSTTTPNSSALLVLRTDGEGETLQVDVAEASGGAAAWDAIAKSLLQALRGKKLRVPHGSGGVTMQLRVDSRNALPSGADPGLAIDLFGQEVKAGAGDRSTRLQLLTPKITLEEFQLSPTDPHVKIPVVGLQLTIFAIRGDPVDIGAVARRVVHAHLVSLETHPPEPKH